MVHTCCVVGCTNRRQKEGTMSFHKFPWVDRDRANQWVANISRQTIDGKAWIPSTHDRVCSAHFKDSDYQTHTKTQILKPDAVPTIFPHYPKHKQVASTSHRPPPQKRSTIPTHNDSREPPCKMKKEDVARNASLDHCYSKESIEVDLENQTEKNRVLTETLTKAKREIKVLKTKVKRKCKRIEDLFSEVEKQKLLDEEKLELLFSNLNGDSRMLFDNELKQSKTFATGRRYSENIKSFAVTLHFYSAQAYDFLRKYLTLPDASTIRRWSSSIGCEPGFLKDALDHLKSRKDEDERMKDVSIIFDSMAIKKEIVFNSKTGHYSGCVDFGSYADSTDHLATEALVVMAVGLRSHWKQPIGYFLDKICANVQCQIIRDAITHLSERGFIVHATVCDGNFANQRTAVNLGCKLTADDMSTEFQHPVNSNDSVFFIFDACHLLKNVRNCLGEYGQLFDGDSCPIKWQYVKALHAEQQKDNLYLGNKLKTKHVDFTKNKMSVKLAAETLSRSVADAIDYLREDQRLPQFTDSEATCKFIRMFDKLFDICNSSSPIGKFSKSPISLDNLSEKLAELETIEKYIRGLTDSTKTKLTTGRRKTAFIGFLVTIKSISMLAQRLFQQIDPFKCLLTYKLSQDHLGCLFSRIRRRGGWNNNPTTLEFKWALRSCMLKNGIRPSKRANCIEIEEPTVSIIDDNTDQEQHVSQEMKKFVEIMQNPSLFHDDVLFYVAGYICRKLLSQLKCLTCLDAIGKRVALSQELREEQPVAALTLRKDRGGLLFSNDIFRIVKEADRVLRMLVIANSFTALSSRITTAVQVAVCEKLRGSLFEDLTDHVRDTYDPLSDDHGTQIIKLVCRTFTNVLFRHNARVINERFVRNCKAPVRHKFTKMILFLHQ